MIAYLAMVFFGGLGVTICVAVMAIILNGGLCGGGGYRPRVVKGSPGSPPNQGSGGRRP